MGCRKLHFLAAVGDAIEGEAVPRHIFLQDHRFAEALRKQRAQLLLIMQLMRV